MINDTFFLRRKCNELSGGAPSVARSGFAGQETSYNRVFATLRIDECGQDASQTLESL